VKLLLLLLFISCSGLPHFGSPKEIKRNYVYIDVSGKYRFTREHKLLNQKIVTRTQLTQETGDNSKVLEKSITVSQLGTVKKSDIRSLVVRPYGSEFSVWLEGKKYDSKSKLDQSSKSLEVDLQSPESKWNGIQRYPFPRDDKFCYFSQIPECLYHNLLLLKSIENPKETYGFTIVWDGFPFIQDQLNGVGQKLFSKAKISYEKSPKNEHRIVVEFEGQSVLYHFSKSFDLIRMLWIAQGISIIPPDEDVNDPEE